MTTPPHAIADVLRPLRAATHELHEQLDRRLPIAREDAGPAELARRADAIAVPGALEIGTGAAVHITSDTVGSLVAALAIDRRWTSTSRTWARPAARRPRAPRPRASRRRPRARAPSPGA